MSDGSSETKSSFSSATRPAAVDKHTAQAHRLYPPSQRDAARTRRSAETSLASLVASHRSAPPNRRAVELTRQTAETSLTLAIPAPRLSPPSRRDAELTRQPAETVLPVAVPAPSLQLSRPAIAAPAARTTPPSMPYISPPPEIGYHPSLEGAARATSQEEDDADAGPSRIRPPADLDAIRHELANAIENFEPIPRSSSHVVRQLIDFAAKKIVRALQHYDQRRHAPTNLQASQISGEGRQAVPGPSRGSDSSHHLPPMKRKAPEKEAGSRRMALERGNIPQGIYEAVRKRKRSPNEQLSDEDIAQILTWKSNDVTTNQIYQETRFPGKSVNDFWSWYKLHKSSDPAEALVRSTIPDHLVFGIQSLRKRTKRFDYDAKTTAQVVIWKGMNIDTRAIWGETGIAESLIDKWWVQYGHLLQELPTTSGQ